MAMNRLTLPSEMQQKLSSDREFEAIVARSISSFEPVLFHGQPEFFPDYTDHGINHIQDTLTTAWTLATERSKDLLGARDVACLICAVLLHDAGMYLGKSGLVRLVADTTRLRSVEWFKTRQREESWRATWIDFRQEASRMSGKDNIRLFGHSTPVRSPPMDVTDSNSDDWTPSQVRLIGEFVRRHHGRLAHEIALHGFPGTDAEVDILTAEMPLWFRDAVGITAAVMQ